MSAVGGDLHFVDLTVDSEGETKRMEVRGTEVDMIDVIESDVSDFRFDSSSPAPSILKAKSAKSRPGTTKKAIPRTNAKRSCKKLSSDFSQWRSGQNFEDIDAEESPLAKQKKRKLEREAEQKQLGERIQELAAAVGWNQPKRTDQRTTKKNSIAIPYRYKEERLVVCSMCDDKVPTSETSRLRCKHRHCNGCLQRNFQMVINSPNMWPAKCCGPLDEQLAFGVLSKEDFEKFLDVKRSKQHTSTSSCYNCHKQLLLVNIIGNSSGFCLACDCVTCIHCTKEMHEGACLLDPETEKLLKVAQGKRWSKCPRCSNMVERNTGCNSMMCRCGTNFCYRCGRDMQICRGGNCSQIEFQSDMWQKQSPHTPLQLDETKREEYRHRSKKGEEELQTQRNAMAEQNSKALEKQQVVSEILSLRAKLDKISPRRSSPKAKASPTPTPTPAPAVTAPVVESSPTPVGIKDAKQKWPALMKALEDRPKPEDQVVLTAKVSSLLETYRKSFPAVMKEFDGKKKSTPAENTVDLTAPDVKDGVSTPKLPDPLPVFPASSLFTMDFDYQGHNPFAPDSMDFNF
ncbi:hypothetical protein TWF696_005838 [Orbilia brochopaga]|uniref:RBR-type E3 ubiquitin transferase n=1 Tax=Orbilia brochopaga TaxID=3140254 RepID=A0AAV9UV95_9PEZI